MLLREPGGKRAPAHAGRLSRADQLAFALAIVAMGAFVVAVTVSALAARDQGRSPAASGLSRHPSRAGRLPATSPAGDRALAAALAAVRQHAGSNIAVGVIDRTAGTAAAYHGRDRFRAAGVAGADLLAALLLQGQQADRVLSRAQLRLAGQMLAGDGSRAGDLIGALLGGIAGLSRANRALGLRQTRLDPGRNWGLTRTTVADQLRLLTDLTSASSPLSAASRSVGLVLLGRMGTPGWGVKAAAPGTEPAALDGWLAGPGGWVMNSIGVIRSHRHQLLVVVLADRQRAKSAGAARVTAAVRAAVTAVTGRPLPGRPIRSRPVRRAAHTTAGSRTPGGQAAAGARNPADPWLGVRPGRRPS